MTSSLAKAPTTNGASPWQPHPVRITAIQPEVDGINTYSLRFVERAVAARYRFEPGQFNMLYLPGFGEAAISISSDPARAEPLEHTVRVAGNVTGALARKQVGDIILLRGPFGRPWPMDACRGCDLVIASGGVGLAPLRPALQHIVNHRDDYGRVWLLYGARSPGDLLYTNQYAVWRDSGIDVEVTVDVADEQWTGNIGVVPMLFYRLRLEARRTRVLTCGPEIMMRFVVFEALARKVHPQHIYLSMERNMQCAVGMCGHCQVGPVFVCRDGPVFTYEEMEPYMHLEDL